MPGYYNPFVKRYGFFNFLWDLFMILITCGAWFVWIFVREMRGQRG